MYLGVLEGCTQLEVKAREKRRGDVVRHLVEALGEGGKIGT